jgi:hypothetical protein
MKPIYDHKISVFDHPEIMPEADSLLEPKRNDDYSWIGFLVIGGLIILAGGIIWARMNQFERCLIRKGGTGQMDSKA